MLQDVFLHSLNDTLRAEIALPDPSDYLEVLVLLATRLPAHPPPSPLQIASPTLTAVAAATTVQSLSVESMQLGCTRPSSAERQRRLTSVSTVVNPAIFWLTAWPCQKITPV